MTDHGNLFGAIEFQKKATAKGIKPIFGIEIYLLPKTQKRTPQTRPYHLILLAENNEGYHNLLRLISLSWIAKPDKYNRPLTTYADLQKHSKGLIALSSDMGGEIAQAVLHKNLEEAISIAKDYRRIFGKKNFFLEVQRHEGIPESQIVCDAMVSIGKELDIPLVATNNVHYLNQADYEAHAILMCIGMEKRIDKTLIEQIPWKDLHLKSDEEMRESFADLPQALENTTLIAERCNVQIKTGSSYLPKFPIPKGMTETLYFKNLARDGLKKRFLKFGEIGKIFDQKLYEARLEHEMEIIVEMGFPGYFLIVWEFIRWAKEQKIPVGPGRGSGAGSLVAYSLQITNLDPIPYELLFERFLNPERVSMPDFDIDFCQNRRSEVINYVTQRYGKHNVAQIVTFGQLKAKAVIRDVGRVLNLSYAEVDRLSKLIPLKVGTTLEQTYRKEHKFRELIASNETIEYLYDIACSLEGNNRNTGLHAAGVVISEKPLWEYVPVLLGTSGEIVSQYAKNEVEDAGLVKFDFLGLKTLTVIDETLRLIEAGGKEPVDFDTISLENPNTYKLITSGDTVGIFQMESSGFQKMVQKIKPDCFEDIVATVALYRPGPMSTGMVDDFINVKHGRQKIKYPHPLLKDLLYETNGVIVYQEQVMKAAQILAGYSLGGADILRRAMGKKKPKEMDRQRIIFVEGAAKNNISEKKANDIFDLIAGFAGYGFNKSHSAAYALLSFQTAYLKYHYPTEFFAALMTLDANNTSKIVLFINNAKNRKVQILPPDVNESNNSFSISKNAVRFGLGAIKGIGSGPIEAIIEARSKKKFTSLSDFCERVDLKRVSKRSLVTLISCGAFDQLMIPKSRKRKKTTLPTLYEIGKWRAQLLAVAELAIARGQKAKKDREQGQNSLFGLFFTTPKRSQITYPTNIDYWNSEEVLDNEKQLLGFYISGHPLDRFKNEIGLYTDTTTEMFQDKNDKDKIKMAGVIVSKQKKMTKKGKPMAFFELEDHVGNIEIVIWPATYNDTLADILETTHPVIVTGRVSIKNYNKNNDEEQIFVADNVELLSEVRSKKITNVSIQLNADEIEEEDIRALSIILEKHPGDCSVILNLTFSFTKERARITLKDDNSSLIKVEPSDELNNEISARFGGNSVRFLG